MRVRVEEQREPTLTVCGRLVRKPMIQAPVEVGRSRSVSLLTRMSGMIILKAEL